MLFDDRWAVVSWPAQYGGRDASLWEWLIFEEEYYRAGGPQRVTQNGIFLLAPTVFEFGTPGAAGPHPPADGGGRGPVVPGLVGAQRRAATSPACSSTVRDEVDGGWMPQRPEDVDDARRVLHPPVRAVPQRPGAERHRGLTYFLVPLDRRRRHRARFGRLDGDEGFAEVFFDDVFVPTKR